MRFRAFLSYSHADATWARWLLRRLETYRIPSRLVGTQGAHGLIERRLGKFFRDRDELPSAGDLGVTIHDALADSDALVVICSPAAAQSRWVNAEVEAFQASGRGDRVFCFVVDGMPGSEDQAQACFPPALVRPDANGEPHEPLAADARAQGDGLDRAFLKLVAGLLGVGYDALAQREAQRRTRKLATVAAASLLGMTIALGLAATAYVARNDAQRRQAQAEDILGFMLGDLRKKLTTVGRLDLMRSVDDKATGYFATLDPRDMTDRALEEQARSLTGIGEVRLGEGNHDAAMVAFREAHARSTALYQRAPDNGQRLFDLAQAEYWIGHVALQQGRNSDAGPWFKRYRDSAVKLSKMDPEKYEWQLEVAYGLHNLAVLDYSEGRIDAALRAFADELVLYRHILKKRPHDTAARFQASDAASWLGSIAVRDGRLEDAESYMAEQVAGMRQNLLDEPDNARWKELHIDALLLLADVQARRGRLSELRDTIQRTDSLALALAKQDPANNAWQVSPGIVRWWQAQLSPAEQMQAAEKLSEEAASYFDRILKTEPDDQRVRIWLVKAQQLRARLALDRNDSAASGMHLTRSVKLVEPVWRKEPDEALRTLYAENLILQGELARIGGDENGARRSWHQARQILLGNAQAGVPLDRMEPLVRILHHLGLFDESRAYERRLAAAGFVPLRKWPLHPASGKTAVAVAEP